MERSIVARRVFLHVGSPKTGTTFVQDLLWSQRAVAQEQGLLLPLESFHDHFLASVDVRDIAYQAHFPPRAIGIWKRLADEAAEWSGDVLVSHELLAAATAEQAEAAVRALDGEVHVVVTARDLQRQIPAEWQEHVKHRSATTFEQFVSEVRAGGPAARWFWQVQDCAAVCRRWGAVLPPGNVHVITVPARGTPRDVLWRRFAGVLGLDAATFEAPAAAANPSLGAAQAELLRLVNERLGERLPLPGPYVDTVKDVFAARVLAGACGTPVTLSPADSAYAVERAREVVHDLQAQGVHIVGDVSELVGALSAGDSGTAYPQVILETVLLNASVDALCGVLAEYAAQRRQLVRSHRVNRQLRESSTSAEGRGVLVGVRDRAVSRWRRHVGAAS